MFTDNVGMRIYGKIIGKNKQKILCKLWLTKVDVSINIIVLYYESVHINAKEKAL